MIGLVVIGSLVTFIVLATIGSTMANAAATSAATPDDTVTDDSVSVPDVVSDASPVNQDPDTQSDAWQQNITTDENTWPSGDKVWDICRAIAIAEGYNTNGVAFQLNNPGDISDGQPPYAGQSHDGSNVTMFPDASTGWNYLYQKISNHVNGKSSVYPVAMTIDMFAKKYAGAWQNWENNVCSVLGVKSSTTFAQYVNGN